MFASSTLLLFGFDAKVPADWHARVETVLGSQDREMPEEEFVRKLKVIKSDLRNSPHYGTV
jgi:hypothetical protein